MGKHCLLPVVVPSLLKVSQVLQGNVHPWPLLQPVAHGSNHPGLIPGVGQQMQSYPSSQMGRGSDTILLPLPTLFPPGSALSPASGVGLSVLTGWITGLQSPSSTKPAACTSGDRPRSSPVNLPLPPPAPSPCFLSHHTWGTRGKQWRNPNTRLRNGADVSELPFAPSSHGTDMSHFAARQAGEGQRSGQWLWAAGQRRAERLLPSEGAGMGL